jgi:hypothetical protein
MKESLKKQLYQPLVVFSTPMMLLQTPFQSPTLLMLSGQAPRETGLTKEGTWWNWNVGLVCLL